MRRTSGAFTHNGNHYRLNANFRRMHGWVNVGNYRYYFGTNGRRQSNRWVTTDGHRYFVQANGRMARGRARVNDGTYRLFNRSGRDQGVFNPGRQNRHMYFWSPPALSGNTTVNLNLRGLDDHSRRLVIRAINNWNEMGLSVRLRSYDNGPNPVEIGVVPATAIGQGQGLAFGGLIPGHIGGNHLSNFRIVMNRDLITLEAERTDLSFDTVFINVMLHEMSHAVGLEDNPPYAGSIMNQTRPYRDALTLPDYDRDSIRMIYD